MDQPRNETPATPFAPFTPASFFVEAAGLAEGLAIEAQKRSLELFSRQTAEASRLLQATVARYASALRPTI